MHQSPVVPADKTLPLQYGDTKREIRRSHRLHLDILPTNAAMLGSRKLFSCYQQGKKNSNNLGPILQQMFPRKLLATWGQPPSAGQEGGSCRARPWGWDPAHPPRVVRPVLIYLWRWFTRSPSLQQQLALYEAGRWKQTVFPPTRPQMGRHAR